MRCEECGVESVGTARGWRGYIAHDPDEDDPPFIAIFCPVCSEREFGESIRHRPAIPPTDWD